MTTPETIYLIKAIAITVMFLGFLNFVKSMVMESSGKDETGRGDDDENRESN